MYLPAIPVQTDMMQDHQSEPALLKKAVRKIPWNECHRDRKGSWREEEHDRPVSRYPAHFGTGGHAAVRDGRCIMIILEDVTEHVPADLGIRGNGEWQRIKKKNGMRFQKTGKFSGAGPGERQYARAGSSPVRQNP